MTSAHSISTVVRNESVDSHRMFPTRLQTPIESAGARLLRILGSPGRGLLALGRTLATTVLLGSLQAYKLLISPLLGSRCRFHPSCSVYAQDSIQRFGPLKGTWLALLRLGRCGPWHPGGIDEVPECTGSALHPKAVDVKAADESAAGMTSASRPTHRWGATHASESLDSPLPAAVNRNWA